jgi:hypothetical protein
MLELSTDSHSPFQYPAPFLVRKEFVVSKASRPEKISAVASDCSSVKGLEKVDGKSIKAIPNSDREYFIASFFLVNFR